VPITPSRTTGCEGDLPTEDAYSFAIEGNVDSNAVPPAISENVFRNSLRPDSGKSLLIDLNF
jgi:hypothetical protein